MAASEVKLLHLRRRTRSPRARPSLKMRPLCSIVTLSTTRSATSMSCSMMMKPMCLGIEVRISISSAALPGRQAGGGLVEQDEARRAGQRQRDLELALLAVAQLADQLIAHVLQMHGLDQAFGRLQQDVAARAAVSARSVRARRRGRRGRRCRAPTGRRTARRSDRCAAGRDGCARAAESSSRPRRRSGWCPRSAESRR